jgi:hypothetical protein
MRFLVLSVSALCATCLGSGYAVAQAGQSGQAEGGIPPYSIHLDRRHGNDHVYPDRGAIVRDLPRGSAGVNYAGISYRFVDGVWYQRLGPAYMVVEPPIGVVIPRLPAFATDFDIAGKVYLYANDVFYSSRPDLGGYEVVNDPQDEVTENAQAPPDSSPSRVASVAPSAVAAAAASAPARPTELAAQPNQVTAPPVTPGNPTQVTIRPRSGQSADQQAMDRYECYRFGVAQSGFDPLATYGSAPADAARNDSEFSRAQAECLEGRGYSVP